jgi:hypothetical protein
MPCCSSVDGPSVSHAAQEVESVVPDMALNPTSPSKTTNFDGFTFVDEGHLGK